MQQNSHQKSSKKNSGGSSKKNTLIIDLRPLQSGRINGVTISSKNWIEGIINNTKKSSQIYLWSNCQKAFETKWKNQKHVTHIHTSIPNKILNISLSILKWPKIDKLLKVKADTYFCPDLRPFAVTNSVKSVMYIHDVAFIKYKEFYSLKSKIWYRLINPKSIYKRLDKVITNSNFSKIEIQKYIAPRHITIVHPFLDKKYETKNIKKKENYFVCIGTIQKRKNLENTIKGFLKFNENKDYKLKIIGTADSTFSKTKKIQNKNIEYLGSIQEKEKIRLIKKSKGLLYLSFYEGFGMPILEAIKLNTPALVSESSPFIELFEKEVVYCKPRDIGDIAKGIENLLKHKLKNEVEYSSLTEIPKLLRVLLKK